MFDADESDNPIIRVGLILLVTTPGQKVGSMGFWTVEPTLPILAAMSPHKMLFSLDLAATKGRLQRDSA